ncbi:MAG TPA: hypothetical protein DCP55_06150 [Chitinophagaceae bacterium]|nr:hypothetical protein [Chitinophagaceae bacterium]
MRAKFLLLLLLLVGGQQFSFAQFQSARLQATGLTCALCSKAIHESLQKLPFVAKVEADIQSSAFSVQFRKGETQNPDALKTAVEEAGFFVGELLLEGQWAENMPASSVPFNWGGNWYYFLSSKAVKDKSTFTLSVIDKGFVTDKAYKKYLSQYKQSSFSTGFFTEDSLSPDKKQRLFHVLTVK